MNGAELLDSKMAMMPLSVTRQEVNDIANYIQFFDLRAALKIVSDNIHSDNVRHILLIGSGDSYALALLYAALFNEISALPARAIQAGEILRENVNYLNKSWLVIVLSASGRPSSVLDALIKVQATQAQVISITNTADSPFAVNAHNLVTTQAKKVGMPTQSSIASALYLDVIGCTLIPDYKRILISELTNLRQKMACLSGISKDSWYQTLLCLLFSKRVTLLGSGGDFGLALLLSNLLWCGPQLPNQVLQLEEYEHALRLNQASLDDLVIVFDCTGNSSLIADRIVKRLTNKKLEAIYIDNEFLSLMMRENSSLFSQSGNCRYYAMMFIFSLIISATENHLLAGGSRVSLEQNI
uniref:SIS domain-containing protein n=1 Tax=Yersinia frederiksenii TaxID=29484 RepID=UPI001F4C50EC|nr:SIS domain-containing protein [Yersinia frederiksenii]ULG19853.1 hypothetical protein 49p1_00144 [Yersinia frederiksenii]